MIFWIMLIVLALSIFWYEHSDYDFIPAFISTIASLAATVMVVILIVQYTGVDAYIDSNNVRYEMLKTQYENHFYDNDNDVGKQELVSKIQEWNEDLAYNKRIQRDLWLGIFYPNIYDQFDYIEIN